MKKPDRARELIKYRIGERRRLDEIARRRALIRRSVEGDPRFSLPPGARFDEATKRHVITVPSVLNLVDSRIETLGFVQTFRKAVFLARRRILLDFAECTRISPPAMLYLLAEIYRCRRSGSPQLLTGTYPKHDRVHRQMQACGFFRLLNVTERLPPTQKVYPLEYIPFMTGTQSVGRDADYLRTALLGPQLRWKHEASEAIYRGLTEAMTNVVHHAYPAGSLGRRIPRMRDRWWMVGHFDERRKELRILFVDQGVGIPRTVPKKHTLQAITAALSRYGITSIKDGELIQAAMEIGRTKTRRAHQGLGLNDFKRLTDACKGGSLRILSNHGEYRYTYQQTEQIGNHEQSIEGTMIEWSVPLAAIENWNPEPGNEHAESV